MMTFRHTSGYKTEEINLCLTESLKLSMPDVNAKSKRIIFSNHLNKRQMVFAITISDKKSSK